MAFRPYTEQELHDAATAYGVDPAFVDAIYAAESSRGTNPKAMTARTVKRKRDSTIVRGPFQLEDATTSDIIRENRLGNVDVNNPDVHLDLALRLMKKLQDQYNGDYGKMAQAYFGGPGSVGTGAQDETGTSTNDYERKVLSTMAARNVSRPRLDASTAVSSPELQADITPIPSSSPQDSLYGIPDIADSGRLGQGATWGDLIAANKSSNSLGIPGSMNPSVGMNTDDNELNAYIQSLVDDELKSKDFANAA